LLKISLLPQSLNPTHKKTLDPQKVLSSPTSAFDLAGAGPNPPPTMPLPLAH